MRNFDVLDPQQQILGPHFLEASAGTGKTFAIEHIVVRLLLEDPAITLRDILVVTFTRAATRELKQRIRQCLKKALEGIRSGSAQALYLQTVAREKKARDRAINTLQEALSALDQMQVFTIHGFCHNMLTTYAFDAGISLQEIKSEQRPYQQVQREQILDFLRSGLNTSGFHRHQIHKVLKKTRYDMNALAQRIVALVNKEALFPQLVRYESLLESFKTILSTYPMDRGQCLEQFFLLAPLFTKISSTKQTPHVAFLEQAHILAECLDQVEKVEEGFARLLAYDEWFCAHLTEASLKKKAKTSFERLHSQYSLISLAQKLHPILLEATDDTKILLRLAAHSKARIHEALMREGLATPDALLQWMHKALMRPAFCTRVQERYKAAIVDEFQDTDPLQWDIFYSLFLVDRAAFPLYLVGDPKQSIYGFRNADLPTYLQAAQKFSDEQKGSLSVNYRSEPRLIQALNCLFLASPQWLSHDKTLRYQEVQANPEATNTDFKDGYAPIHFFVTQQKATREKHFPSKETEEKRLFPFIAQEIFKLQRQGKSFSAFAILIRDRFQGERLERYLKKIEIPCVATSIVNLVDTEAFSFLKMVCMLLQHIDDISAIKLVLAHPFMGFSHEELRIDVQQGKAIGAIVKLKTLATVYLEQGFFLFWDQFLQTAFDEEDTFEQMLVRKDMQHYHDLNQLVEILAEEHECGTLSHAQLLYTLERLEEQDPETNEALKRKVFFEEEAVTIMTMHKSKGLEFDIVFALGVAARSSVQEEVIRCDHELAIVDEGNVTHQQVLQSMQQEKLRQLYVTLTRAKTRVYIPLCFSAEMRIQESKKLSPMELFLQEIFKEQDIDIFSPSAVIAALQALDTKNLSFTDLEKEEPIVLKRVQQKQHQLNTPLVYTKKFVDRYTTSYSKMAQEMHGFESKTKETPLLPASAETGNVFHKILEKIFERGLYYRQQLQEIEQHNTMKSLITQEVKLSRLTAFEEEIHKIISTVLDIRFTLGEIDFSFQDISPSHLVTEIEFLLTEKPSQIFKGFIDLCFQYEDKYYLVDWKSNFLGLDPYHYEKTALERCMKDNNYFLQAELYGKAMKTYLKNLGKQEAAYGGIFYVFLRGLQKEASTGIYHVP